jgi:hypothetical protein
MLLLSAFPVFLPSGTVHAAGWLGTWAHRYQLFLDKTQVYSDLTNFPVMVAIRSSSGVTHYDLTPVFDELGTASTKIAVATSDGTTECYVEVEKWDSVAEQAVLWVKVPTLSSVNTTILYLYYDSAQAANVAHVGVSGSAVAQNVWNANYVGVYHFAETCTGAAGEVLDSTSKNHDGQGMKVGAAAYPAVATNSLTGGYAVFMDGGDHDPGGSDIQIPNTTDFSQVTTGNLMISFWMNAASLTFPESNAGEHYTRIMAKGGPAGVEYNTQFYSSGSPPYPGLAPPGTLTFYAYGDSQGIGYGAGINSPGINPGGTWIYYTMLLSPALITAWVNADPYTTWPMLNGGYTERPFTVGESVSNKASPLVIGGGRSDDTYGFFYGSFAEWRVSNVDRGENWIRASFYSERDALITYAFDTPPTDIDIGAAAVDRVSGLNNMTNFTVLMADNPANASGTLSKVYVYPFSVLTGLTVGTYYNTGVLTYKCRDSEAIANPTNGTLNEYNVSIDCVAGDIIGIYATTGGSLAYDITGAGIYYVNAEEKDPGDESVYLNAAPYNTWAMSLYATGELGTDLAAPTSVVATDGAGSAVVTVTWTKSVGATGYRVYRDGSDISGLLGDVATYDDAGAGAPSITAGSASAAKGLSPTYVRLLVSGEVANNGTTHSYKVVAVSGAVTSPDSTLDTGYRGISAISYQWQRSATDSNSGYGSIVAGTTESYNDVGGVVTPDGRYYRCVLTASGASNVTTSADRGYMVAAGAPGSDDTSSAQGKTIMRDMLPLAVIAGILVGIVTAARSDNRSFGKMLSNVMIGIIAFVLLWAMLQALM